MLIFVISVVSFLMTVAAVSSYTLQQDLKAQQAYVAKARVEQVKAAVVREYRYFSDDYLTGTYNNKRMYQGLHELVSATGERNAALRPLLMYQDNYATMTRPYQAYATYVNNTGAGIVDRKVLVYSPLLPGNYPLTSATSTMVQTRYTDATTNKCGATSFYSAQDWCGDTTKGAYDVFNEREFNGEIEFRIKEQLKATAATYRNAYLGGVAFPTTSGVLHVMTTPIGSSTKLDTSVGTSCSGNFRHGPSIVLSCLDLYNQGLYNARVSYTYINAKSIQFSAVSANPVRDAGGNITYPPITQTLTMP